MEDEDDFPKRHYDDGNDTTAVLVSTKARVIRALPADGRGLITFDIAKDPQIPVGIDGLIKVPPECVHQKSQVRGHREDESEGTLFVTAFYMKRAARKGWF